MQKKDDDFAVQLKKVEEFWKKKVDDKEKDLQRVLDKKDVEISTLLSEIKELQVVISKLETDVKLGEGNLSFYYKQKVIIFLNRV